MFRAMIAGTADTADGESAGKVEQSANLATLPAGHGQTARGFCFDGKCNRRLQPMPLPGMCIERTVFHD
jgi:hypothetical protein